MEPLDKLEIIIKYHLAEKKRKRENSTHSSSLYILELDREISMLQKIRSEIDAIKRNHYLTSDEMITKLYGGTIETTACSNVHGTSLQDANWCFKVRKFNSLRSLALCHVNH